MQTLEKEESLDRKLYKLLSTQLGRDWDKVVEDLKCLSDNGAGHIIWTKIIDMVHKDVHKVPMNGNVYDNTKDFNVPLMCGKFYLEPSTKILCMVGEEKASSSVSSSAKSEKKENEKRYDEIMYKMSERQYLCRRADGSWVEVEYELFPTWDQFREPIKFLGHIDYVKNPKKTPYKYRKVNADPNLNPMDSGFSIEDLLSMG